MTTGAGFALSHRPAILVVSAVSALACVHPLETSEAVPLSVDHLQSIEQFLRWRAHGISGPVELLLRGDRLVITALEGPALAVDWLGGPVDLGVSAVGLCLPAGDRFHLGAIVDRAGRSDWFVVCDGDVRVDGTPSCLLVDDLCRRRLGLPTDPPATTTDWFWLEHWLTDVVAAARGVMSQGAHGLLDPVAVAGCHPAVEIEDLIGLDRTGITSFVVERHRDHVVVADWGCVRLDAMVHDRHVGHEWAHHLDDGAFSRWVSSAGIPLSSRIDDLVLGCSSLALELIGAVISDVIVRQSVR